jgi:hypothetical protein
MQRLLPWAAALLTIIALIATPTLGRAEPTKPTAAVLPTQGPLSPESLKTITIEFRSRIRERGYLLARQRDVRRAASQAGVSGPPTVEQMAGVGRAVGASLVFSPLVVGQPGKGWRIELLALRSPHTALGPIAERLTPVAGAGLDLDDVEHAVASLVSRLLEPFPAEPVEQQVDLAADEHDQPQKMKDYRGSVLDEYDHEGFFADLAFVLAICRGDTMCQGVNPGLGGRLRVGYRIRAYVALSVTGIGAGHNVPVTTDAEEIARTDRAFAWAGVYGGVRYHPINKHWFDPFIGFDMGWTWLIYTELVKGTSDSGMSYMGVEISEFYSRRNNLSMNGFTFVPQIGLHFYVMRNVSLGLALNWLIPVWKEACTEFKEWEFGERLDSGDKCIDVDEADSGFLEMEHGELADRDELPWFFNLEIVLAFTF